MSNGRSQENALISVYDKTGVEEFADGITSQGFNIYASGGTAKRIGEAGIPVTDVAELVGGGAILGHRVVTISREIAAALLATDSEEDVAELERLGIPRIDLVRVDMYPLEEEIAKPSSTEEDVIEQTDIGGPNMLRMGAKGRRIVVPTAELQAEVLLWLQDGRPNENDFRRRLAAEAEFEAARYVLESAKYLGGKAVFGFAGKRIFVPRYGENGWQEAALYSERSNTDPLSFKNFNQEQGKELSYNNLIDSIERGNQTITHIVAAFKKRGKDLPAAVGVKHGNPCGAGVAKAPVEAVQKMLDGEPEAIFGGVVSLSFEIDSEVAHALLNHGMANDKTRFLEVVMAAGITDEAREILGAKPNLRVLTNSELGKLDENSLDKKRRAKHLRGGDLLVQDNYTMIAIPEGEDLEIWGNEASEEEKDDMTLAAAIDGTSNSNTIAIVKNSMLLANGVGQQARHIAAWLATERGKQLKHDLVGASAGSDSFFPEPDAPLILLGAGIKNIFGLRGSNNDDKVKEAIIAAGGTQYTLPNYRYRRFYAH
jgi:phosphoribosylaminoimidazolecarboxamide formyltransferase/IMP cyclohydrolase